MKQIIFIIISIILVLPLVQSATEYQIINYEVNKPSELYVTCKENNEKLCDASTTCNISELLNPSGVAILEDIVLTRRDDGYYNYSYTFTSTGEFFTQKVVCTNTSKIARTIKLLRVVDLSLINAIEALNISIENLTIENIAEEIWQYGLGSNLSANETLTEVHTGTKGIPDIAMILSSLTMTGIFFFMGFRQNGKRKRVGQDGEIVETKIENPIAYLFFFGAFLGILLSLNIARASAEAGNASANLISMINTSYIIALWVFLIASVLMITLTIVKLVKYRKHRKEMEEEGLLDDDE